MTVLFFFSATTSEIFLSVLHSPWTVPAVPAFDRGAAAAAIAGEVTVAEDVGESANRTWSTSTAET